MVYKCKLSVRAVSKRRWKTDPKHSLYHDTASNPEVESRGHNGPNRPRRPEDSAHYQCFEDHFETFEQVYEERMSEPMGFSVPICGP